jgi:hypothetical protein
VSGDQIVFLSVTFVLILGSALAAQFGWLPRGKVGFVLAFIAGAGSVLGLWLAGIPPTWFEGGKTGFGLALSLALGAFVTKGEEKPYGFPLMSGMALTLLAANVAALVT